MSPGGRFMDKGITILCFLLFISGCVIIHLVNKLRDVKGMILGEIQDPKIMDNIVKELEKKVNNDFMDMWDNEYKAIVANYGDTKSFIEAHYTDYDIYRSNVLVFISKIKGLSGVVTKATDFISDSVKKNKKYDKDLVLVDLEVLNKSLVKIINEIADEAAKFVESEEEAHSDRREIYKVLERLPKEIKEVNFYEQKED
jgi:hypothetical protein